MATESSARDIDNAIELVGRDIKELSALNKGEPPLELDAKSPDLIVWQNSASKSLETLENATSSYLDLTATQRAKIVATAAIFVGQDNFTNEDCRTRAQGCLGNLGSLDRPTVSCVLTDYVKPLFQTSAHPGVRPDTGRVKQNPLSVQNMYDDQLWKVQGVGCWNVLSWVLLHIGRDDIETLWPLIIPPLLTLLEDYKPRYRIAGINTARNLLDRVSAQLLKRTGVDELLFKALRGTLQNLTSDESPDLLRAAMPCYLALVNLIHPDDDLKRFNRLSESIIEAIVPGWLYASSKIEVMIASVEALLPVVQALGAGSVRFLRLFIPQLTENLAPREFSPIEPTRHLQNASARCLLTVMRSARPRIAHWRLRILDAILRCWVETVKDWKENAGSETEQLRTNLADIFSELLLTSGHLLRAELSSLEALDAALFFDLLMIARTLESSEGQVANPIT